MQVRLQIRKRGTALQEGISDISDADSFGRACADLWVRLQEQKLAKATSIGALYDRLEERLLDDLYGAEISLSKP